MDNEKVKKYTGIAGAGGFALGVIGVAFFPAIAPAAVGLAGMATAVGAFAGFGSAAGAGAAVAQELWLNTVRGKVVQIFGPKQVGKNSIYNAITQSDESGVDPTSESTKKIYEDKSRADLNILKDQAAPAGFLEDIYEVSGENVSKWKEVIEETNPHGIIYVVSSCTDKEYRDDNKMRKERFELEAQGLSEICETLISLKSQVENINIKSFLILVNKADLVPEFRDRVADEYKNQLEDYFPNANEESLFELLEKAVGENIPIRVERFCAHYGQRGTQSYKEHNSKVILQFWKDILK